MLKYQLNRDAYNETQGDSWYDLFTTPWRSGWESYRDAPNSYTYRPAFGGQSGGGGLPLYPEQMGPPTSAMNPPADLFVGPPASAAPGSGGFPWSKVFRFASPLIGGGGGAFFGGRDDIDIGPMPRYDDGGFLKSLLEGRGGAMPEYKIPVMGISDGGPASQIDLKQAIYQLFAPEALRQQVYGKFMEGSNAQAEDMIRRATDRAITAGGNAYSPNMMAMQTGLRRSAMENAANARRDFEIDWTGKAADRQHAARDTNARLMEQYYQRRHSAAAAFAQLLARAREAEYGLQQGWQRMGLDRDRLIADIMSRDADREIDWAKLRYGADVYNEQKPSRWERAMGGAKMGLDLYGGLKTLFGW